ncbi:hypothetical protein M0K38_000006 [Citrobacter freundii]|uniref:hypothetical protein n=1 Tax=Citrobacter freundii TaxID=546 RepID=UPI001C2F7DAC|nr:hypothetical protein [Citrobacter freundii]EKU3951689.1 hypothetical protein [Citrobacter freundii]
MIITPTEYKDIFIGYYINGVAVRDTGYIYITLREKSDVDPVMQEHLAKKKFVSFFYDEPLGKQWDESGYEGMDKILSASATEPYSQYVGVTVENEVFAVGSGFIGLEEPIPYEFAIKNARNIGGRVYVVGCARSVIRRTDRDQWEMLSKGIQLPAQDQIKTVCEQMLFLDSAGFSCIDGFSETDIYAAGGKGDVWHFNGNEWKQIHFPSNMILESICCGQDGYVYIGAQSGTVFKGRDNQWKMIHRGMLSLPFRQMVWFQDRVWATSDYGVWQIIGDDVIEPDLPAEVKMCSGYISCTESILVLAGYFGVARLENGNWDILVNCVRAEKGDFSSDQ